MTKTEQETIQMALDDGILEIHYESDLIDDYNNFLDENYSVKIAGLMYDASRVLELIDETAYRTGLHDHIESLGLEEFGQDYINTRDKEDFLASLEG